MNLFQERDYELIAEAKKAIRLNYDQEHYNHTVGAAITNGERNFDAIVAVRGKEGEEIIPPCGNCRQILHDYMPDCDVIVSVHGELKKIKAKKLLPFSYSVE